MSLPAVLVRKSTKQILKESAYPMADIMESVPGLDDDLEWLIKRIPFEKPPYDRRLYTLNTNKPDLPLVFDIIPAHPDYPHLREYLITYDTTRKPDEEITVSITNAEQNANEGVFPYTKQLKIMLLGLGVLFRRVEGMQLTVKEQTIADTVLSIATKVWNNDTAMRAKVQELADSIEPNIDEGWEVSE